MAGKAPPRKGPPSPNGAPTLTPLGHYAGRPDIAISRQITVVGSKAGSRLHLASSTVSQSHAVIVNSASGAYIRDLASRTHVIVNGKPQREADLNDGTLLQIGKFKFQFNAGVSGAGLIEPGRSAPVGAFDPAPRAVLNVEGGELPVAIESRSVLIGRRPTCDVPLLEDSVSTAHAIIFEMNGKRFIRDLGSRTGTFVNGEQVEQIELKFGDEIRVGETNIVYAGAGGAVAEREVDELDHLIGTNLLAEAEREAPMDAVPEVEAEQGSAAGDAIPVETGDAQDIDDLIAPVVAEREEEQEPVAAEPPEDQVRLADDPDVGTGPGDTRVLPAEKADAPRKTPTLTANLVDDALEAPAEEPSVVDDALGLTPEARRREHEKAEDLGGSRRGWRGMAAPEPAAPPFEAEPEAKIPAPVESEAFAEAEGQTPAPVVETEPQSAESDLPPEQAVASSISDAEDQAAPAAEPVAAQRAVEPSNVIVGEDTDTVAASVRELPAETFDITEDVSAPLTTEQRDDGAADELHLPPVIDETVDDLDIEPLPLTPEQGAPLDLTVEEPPIDIDAPTPTLKLETPEPDEAPLAAEPIDERVELPAQPVAEAPAAEVEEPAAPEPVADVAPAAEPAAKPKRKRPPRKKKGAATEPVAEAPVEKPAQSATKSRRSKAKADEAPAPVTPAPVAPAPVADVSRDDIEILDDTQPTPESAQAIEDLAADVLSAPPSLDDPMVVTSEASSMSDTGFGRAVDAFIGDSTGPLVEPREEKPVSPAAVDDVADVVDPELEPAAEPLAEAPVEPEDEIELASAAPAQDDESAAADELPALQIEPLDAAPEAEVVAADDETAADALVELAAVEPAQEDAETKSNAAPAHPEELAAAALADLASADTVEPEPDEKVAAPSIDDLLEDVLGPADEAKAEAAAPGPDDTDVDMPALSLEEPAQAEAVEAAAPEEQTSDELELGEPVASQADQPEPTEPKDEAPPSVTPAPPPASPAGSPMNFGANQEHFLGGMPLKLNKPTRANTGPGAGAAAARAPGQPGRTPFMPPPPPRATRPNARTRNPFDAVPAAPPAGGGTDLGASIPPYVGNNPKSSTITTGFDGLAMPPVRQTDVFSQMPATPNAFAAGLAGGLIDDNEDIFSRGAKAAQAPPPTAPRKSPTGSEPHAEDMAPVDEVSESIESIAADAVAPAPAEPAHEEVHEHSPADAVWADEPHADGASDEQEVQPVGAAVEPTRPARALPTPPAFPGMEAPAAAPAPKKKRRWFGLRMLLLLMLLLGGAAAGGIYQFVKKQTEVVGRLRFHNVEALKTIEQQNLLAEQKNLVNDPKLRDAAAAALPQVSPGLRPGFLGDAVAYEQFARTADWAENQKGALNVVYNGNDPAGDRARVRAVMLALYDANTRRAAGRNSAGKGGSPATIRETVETLSAAHTKAQQRVNDLKAQIDQLNVKAQQMPDRKDLDALTAEVALLDKAYTAARLKSKQLGDDLERVRQSLPANPQPAGTAQVPIVDEELTKLQEELAATNKKLEEAKASRGKGADAAQAALDAALAQFEKGIAGAQGLAQDNPELAAYVAAAQKLQASTRELTEQLMRRQQQQQQQLGDLKQRLSDKDAARRADTWKKDPKLKEYTDELEIVRRQYNAAMGGGATKEAEEFKAQIDLLEGMIKARQETIGDDAFLADTIAQLQKMIDSSQRSLEGDRKQTEAVLQEMQAAFTRSQPAVEKMSDAQKELAASLERQLAEVNAARKQYTQAADAASSAGDEETRAAVAALTAKVEARQKELAAQANKAATAEQEQARVAQLKQREAELVSAQSAELTVQKEWEAAQKKLREAQLAEAAAREAGERRDAVALERDNAQKDLDAKLRQLELKRAEASRTVEPIAPTENDVEMTVHDPRPVYALASVGGIVAVFTLLALFTAAGGDDRRSDDVPVADLSPFDTRPMPQPMPRANGNGSTQPRVDDDAPRVAV